ncbi:hypothetical protein GcM3_030004 [Golovinomyces cichoracearum]|uniref:Uncharacterized protein n=1 Tax=Golovinomyces cichoracearum TaxID=62708 RepID=A0A420J520_9PEZI|nr:hypothetical protein GcM3_030004 [Golovinomyces cichoracearum]
MSTITYQVVQIMWAEMAVTESKIITIARIEKIEERLKELTMTEHSMSTTTQNGKSNQDYSKTKHQTNNEEN